MGIKNWNAGIIRPVAVAPAGSFQNDAAPGVWTLDQVAYWQKQGLWPTAGNVLPVGLFALGEPNGSGVTSSIQKITITTTGNSTGFGDLTLARRIAAACSSQTRGVWAGGFDGASYTNRIDYVTIESGGSGVDFGDTTVARTCWGGCSSATRGIISRDNSAILLYVTIASTGNAQEFGTDIDVNYQMACSSPTRGVFAGGENSGKKNNISYVTIATLGNSTDFGDLVAGTSAGVGCSSSTRGLFAGGNTGSNTNVIQYITIDSLGNAVDFGDLISARQFLAACSSSTRGVIGGGEGSNIIQYVTITTAGNATDFGDLTTPTGQLAACSNAHGGL